MELLFGGITKEKIELDEKTEDSPTNIRDLIFWLRSNMLKEKEELFIQGNTIRPGILVLINDTDWELEDGPEYELCNGDTITFISTLHGG
ncbi:Ubiquitin-related modifier 1 [Smittium culicis]|uniref:Ubiquitin-related modifier 1 n=1 Tax=Smittium culicis TaxID=133412 RepID=A0A1R1YEU1_9FUNG|nr:Ubiquitin-related modifier 1 [Smittium culicis]